jgi:ABC-type oligopeptide transport system substrate-binding subunit
MNYDLSHQSGWSPDYGDPATWLDCFLPYGDGFMCKSLGLWEG